MKTKLTIAAIAILGAGAAIAAGPMKNADTDGDGYVSLDEARAAHSARVEERFTEADTNGDGLLSEEERKAAHAARQENRKGPREHRRMKKHSPEEIVKDLDVDSSGGISLVEFQEGRFAPDAETFAVADTDGSGELNVAELGEMIKARRAKRGEKGKLGAKY